MTCRPIHESLLGKIKAVNDACRAELTKKNKVLDKWQHVNDKNFDKEEILMRKQLLKLEQEKERNSAHSLVNHNNVYELLHSSSTTTGDHFKPPGHLPPLIAEKEANRKHKPKSHRQLKQEYAEATAQEKNRRMSEGANVITRRKSEDRRKSMPENGTVNFLRQEHLRIQDTMKRRHSISGPVTRIPKIVLIDEQDNEIVLCEKKSKNKNISSKAEHHTSPSQQDNNMGCNSHHGSRSVAPSHHELDTDHTNGEQITNLYDLAIKTVASADDYSFSGPSNRESNTNIGLHRRNSRVMDESRIPDLRRLDLSALKELENVLQEATIAKDKKHRESDYGLHTAENRIQKRRLSFLEDILVALGRDNKGTINPEELLNCSYLRLSKSNVETLEQLMREKGVNPGIHAHFDVSNYDVFAAIKSEMAEQLEKDEKAKASQKLTGKSSERVSGRSSNDLSHVARHSKRNVAFAHHN